MAVLGKPYRIMYLSKGVTGMTNVVAMVFRPNKTIAGPYTLVEGAGMFRGCYYYDYMSFGSDPEGEHFSRVISRDEGITDIVRFSLYKIGEGDATGVSSPQNPLVAFVTNDTISARVNEFEPAVAVVQPDLLNATYRSKSVFTATVIDQVAEASLSANETLAVPRYC